MKTKQKILKQRVKVLYNRHNILKIMAEEIDFLENILPQIPEMSGGDSLRKIYIKHINNLKKFSIELDKWAEDH